VLVQPGFGGDVFGVVAGQGVPVAQQPGLDVPVQDPERIGITTLSPLDCLGQRTLRPVHPPP
jgi:hypothetical protein